MAAEELVLGTALVESAAMYLTQSGGGPALGLWQVEPKTDDDLYINFLSYRQQLGARFMELRSPALRMNENLSTNLIYGSAVYRLCYYRQPQALPVAGDVESHAAFWKQHYNTPFRPGTVSKYAYKAQKVLKL